MKRIVVLDSGPLGLITNPKSTPENVACNAWLRGLLDNGNRVVVPGIVDYEVRRELIRANKQQGIQRLDAFYQTVEFVPLTQAALLHAAELWARVRQQGKPTTDRSALDGDVILVSQSLALAHAETEIVLATTNTGHFALLMTARIWRDIEA